MIGREFTQELKLEKDGEGWYLQEGKGSAKTRIPESYNAWLDDTNRWYPSSMVSSSNQTIREVGAPIVLLCIQRCDESQNDGMAGDTILVWVEKYH